MSGDEAVGPAVAADGAAGDLIISAVGGAFGFSRGCWGGCRRERDRECTCCGGDDDPGAVDLREGLGGGGVAGVVAPVAVCCGRGLGVRGAEESGAGGLGEGVGVALLVGAAADLGVVAAWVGTAFAEGLERVVKEVERGCEVGEGEEIGEDVVFLEGGRWWERRYRCGG